MGFKHDAEAPLQNYYFNVGLYFGFIVIHIVMTMPAFKRAVPGRSEGTPVERRSAVGGAEQPAEAAQQSPAA